MSYDETTGALMNFECYITPRLVRTKYFYYLIRIKRDVSQIKNSRTRDQIYRRVNSEKIQMTVCN